jgi:hypothetical protein
VPPCRRSFGRALVGTSHLIFHESTAGRNPPLAFSAAGVRANDLEQESNSTYSRHALRGGLKRPGAKTSPLGCGRRGFQRSGRRMRVRQGYVHELALAPRRGKFGVGVPLVSPPARRAKRAEGRGPRKRWGDGFPSPRAPTERSAGKTQLDWRDERQTLPRGSLFAAVTSRSRMRSRIGIEVAKFNRANCAQSGWKFSPGLNATRA